MSDELEHLPLPEFRRLRFPDGASIEYEVPTDPRALAYREQQVIAQAAAFYRNMHLVELAKQVDVQALDDIELLVLRHGPYPPMAMGHAEYEAFHRLKRLVRELRETHEYNRT